MHNYLLLLLKCNLGSKHTPPHIHTHTQQIDLTTPLVIQF